eukprot:15168242-Ditylum_brightwellii.AAC.1
MPATVVSNKYNKNSSSPRHRLVMINSNIITKRQFSSPHSVSPPPLLFEYILQLRFNKVLERAQTHPYEARYTHPRGWTALHASVEYGAPLNVVKALVTIYPTALTKKDWKGNTPTDLALEQDVKDLLTQRALDLVKEQQREQSDAMEKDVPIEQTMSEHSQEAENECTTSNVLDTNSCHKATTTINNKDTKHLLEQIDLLSTQVIELTATCQKLSKQVDALKDDLLGHNNSTSPAR